MQCCVTLQSLFNAGNKVSKVFLLTTGMDNTSVSNIERICNKYKSPFACYEVDESRLDKYDKLSGWSKYTFLKVLIPDYLPHSIDKCLYLDVDTIIMEG